MLDENKKVFLIDFGCAEKFETVKGSHRPNEETKVFGNPHFGSPNAFRGETLSRRDNLIQIVYNLLILYNSLRPLFNQIGQDPQDEALI